MEAALQEGLLAAQKRQPFQPTLVDYAASHFPTIVPARAQREGADVQGSKAVVETASAHVGLRVELLKSMRAALLRQTEGALRRSSAAAAAAAPGPRRARGRRRGGEPAANPASGGHETMETQFFDREAHPRMEEALAGGGGGDDAAARAALFPASKGPPDLADRSLCLALDADEPGDGLEEGLGGEEAARGLAAARAAAAAAPAARPSVVGPDGVRRTLSGDVLARRLQEMELRGIEVLPAPAAAAAGGAQGRSGGRAPSFEGFEIVDFDGVGVEGQGFEWPEEIAIGGGGDGGCGSGQAELEGEGERMHMQLGDQSLGVGRPAAARLPPTFARRGRPAGAPPSESFDAFFVPYSQDPVPEVDAWKALEGGGPGKAVEGAAGGADEGQPPRRLQLPSFRRAAPAAPVPHQPSLSTSTELDRIEDPSDGEGGAGGGGGGGAEVALRQQGPLRSVAIPSRHTGFAGTAQAPQPLAVRAPEAASAGEEAWGAVACTAAADAIRDFDASNALQQQLRQPPQFGRHGGRAAPAAAPLPGPRLRLAWGGGARDPLALRPSVLLRDWAGTRARWRPARRDEDLLLARRPPGALFAATPAGGGGGGGGLDTLGLPLIVIDAGVFGRSLVLPAEAAAWRGAGVGGGPAPGLTAETWEQWRMQALRVAGAASRRPGGAADGATSGAAAAQQQQQRQGAMVDDWWKSGSEEEGDDAMDWGGADGGGGGFATGGGAGAAAAAGARSSGARGQRGMGVVEITFDEDSDGGAEGCGPGGGGGEEPAAVGDADADAGDAGGFEGKEDEWGDLLEEGVEVVGWGGSDGGDGGDGAGERGEWGGDSGCGDPWGAEMELEGDMGPVDVCFDDEIEGEGEDGGGAAVTRGPDPERRLQELQTGLERIREAALQQWRAQKRASALAARVLRPALARAITARQQQLSGGASRSVTMAELRREVAGALGGTAPGFAAALGALAAVAAAAAAAAVAEGGAGEGDPQPRGPLHLRASTDRTDVIVSW